MSNNNIDEKIFPPSPFLFMTEVARGMFGFGAFVASTPFLQFAPKGDGHPVLVLPGLLTSDNVTTPLRNFLKGRNYNAYPWELGVNTVNYEHIEDKIYELVAKIHEESGQKLSLIGWSAGGIFARAVAHEMPHKIRQVITLGSPFKGIKGKSNVEWVLENLLGKKTHMVEDVILEKASLSPPVPSTALYTKADGIVAWQTCLDDKEDNMTENIEVITSHIGMGYHPQALLCIADRLAQKEEEWKPFKNSNFGKTFFFNYPWK